MKCNKIALLLSISLSGGVASQGLAAIPPFYPVTVHKIKVPEKVYPWLPTYAPDGKYILFQNQLDSNIWLSDVAGSQVRCITCNMQFPEVLDSGFTYVFPDMKRVFISKKELSDAPPNGSDDINTFDAYIMECSGTITDCGLAKFIPVDMSGDKTGPYPPLQRRTWHLSPDGNTVAWMDIRQDGTAVVAGKLTRENDKYTVTDMKVITPVGPSGTGSSDTDRLDYASQLWELKSFADGGKSAIFVSELNQNVDSMKVNLETGATTRLTSNPDWDEDGAISPDGNMYALYSWRTRHRMDTISGIPQLRGFMGLPLMRNVLVNYIGSWPGFQCDLSPWLLPAEGDKQGSLVGQPLMTYEKGGNQVPGNNLSGQAFWSPDSTRVLLQGRNREPVPDDYPESMKTKGMMDNEIVIASIDRPSGIKVPVSPVIIGDWAPSVKDWKGHFHGLNNKQTVPGKNSGSATVTYSGILGILSGNVTVNYDNFSDDGSTFVNGKMSSHMGISSPGGHSTIKINIKLSGKHTGSMVADMTDGTGSWETIYDGVKAPALPVIGPCYDALPGKAPLTITSSEVDGQIKITVTASINGDTRPVQNAVIRYNEKSVKTDEKGIAFIPSGSQFTVNAGDTFSYPER